MVSDIEKAFHQIELNPNDRDVIRFLWIQDKKQQVTQENIIIYRFERVPFGVISSPFLLAALIRHHLNKSKTPFAKALMDNLYVDNATLDAETTDETIEKYHQAKKLFKDAKMNLRKFLSNNSKANQAIKEDRQSGRITRILGVTWDIEADVLHIKLLNEDRGTESLSKRMILALVARIYDPLGLISPIILLMKAFLQQLWQEKHS
ncbi:unnamed protein product [Gongylonema pulchrum]|uniref:Reverse transcriptase domain-containing protein n=1 Tax=Gongylonema pulchrum TaxID=637853 RepID=A0A183E432_9BILA|nr:unnamed protein product [Gongylonema pulchrum]